MSPKHGSDGIHCDLDDGHDPATAPIATRTTDTTPTASIAT